MSTRGALIVLTVAMTMLIAAPAMGDAAWTGLGDGVNWSDLNNWSVDPSTAGGYFTLPTGTTSTVDLDTSDWTDYGFIMADDTVTLNVIAGGLLRSPGAENQHNGGTLRQTGGEVNIGNRVKGDAGLTEISGGTFWNTRYTYCDVAAVHIIGSEATSVAIDSWITYGPSVPVGYLDFTLDANGVTPLAWNVYGSGRDPETTIGVDGISAYLAGAGSVGDVIPLFYDTNSVLDHQDSFFGLGLVDNDSGYVALSDDKTGAELTIIGDASVWEGGAFDWNTEHWTVGVAANQLPGAGAMIVDVAGSEVTLDSNQSVAVVRIGETSNSIVNINATRTLDVTLPVGVTIGAAGAMNVNGALNTDVLSTSGLVNLNASSNGTIGTLNVTGGTTTIAASTITQANANSGVLNVAGAGIANLSIAGATVNTTALTTIGAMQVDSGQLNLTGGNLAVPTATLSGGGINTATNKLVVSNTAIIGVPETAGALTVTASDPTKPFEVTGADVLVSRTVTLTGETVTMTAYIPPVVTNGSFESPDLGGGTGPTDPDDWTVTNDVHGNAVFTEGRWDPDGPGADNAGPTDGVQVAAFGDRGGAYDATMKQMIGTVDELGFQMAEMTFDARFGSALGSTGNENSEAVTTIWRAFWEVDGVRQTDSMFSSNLGSLEEGRLIPNWTELVAAGALIDPDREVSSANMGQFSVAIDLSGLTGTEELTLGFEYDRAVDDASWYNTRVFIDNVAVTHDAPLPFDSPETTVVASETSTLALPGVTGAVTLAGVQVNSGQTLTVDSPSTEINLTNLTLGGGARVEFLEARYLSDDRPGTNLNVTVADTLVAGDGVTDIGHYGVDSWAVNLTLADGAAFDWTFGPGPENHTDVSGALTVDGALTIRLHAGGGTASGEDVVLFNTHFYGVTFDSELITIEAPDGWDWDKLPSEAPDIQNVNIMGEWYLVLKNLVTAVSDIPGDVDGDGVVDDDDVDYFQLFFGLRDADLDAEVLAQQGLGNDLDADFNDDNRVNLVDFDMLMANFPTVPTGPAPAAPDFSPVPEPATMSLLAVGALAVLRRRRRRTRRQIQANG